MSNAHAGVDEVEFVIQVAQHLNIVIIPFGGGVHFFKYIFFPAA